MLWFSSILAPDNYGKTAIDQCKFQRQYSKKLRQETHESSANVQNTMAYELIDFCQKSFDTALRNWAVVQVYCLHSLKLI